MENKLPFSRDDYSEDLESQYRRLERIYSMVSQDFDNDKFSKSHQEILDSVYEFFIVCYHLRELIIGDQQVNNVIKNKLPLFTDVDNNIDPTDSKIGLLICRDLCNKSKHGSLDKKWRPNDEYTKINITGRSLFSVPVEELKAANKEKMTIHLKEDDSIFMGNLTVLFRGREYKLLGIVESCMYFWKKFFEENDLIIPRLTPRGN